MGNEIEIQRQQPNTVTVDPSRKNPPRQGGRNPNHQDPSKKNPPRGDDSGQRDGEEGSEQGEKRRVS
jgi:hypothetical protein